MYYSGKSLCHSAKFMGLARAVEAHAARTGLAKFFLGVSGDRWVLRKMPMESPQESQTERLVQVGMELDYSSVGGSG